jgi:hypothetical protein
MASVELCGGHCFRDERQLLSRLCATIRHCSGITKLLSEHSPSKAARPSLFHAVCVSYSS